MELWPPGWFQMECNCFGVPLAIALVFLCGLYKPGFILQLKTCLGASSRGTTLDITYGHWRNEPGNSGGNQPLTSDT